MRYRLLISFLFSVPTDVAVVGAAKGVEGTIISLVCNYTESNPPANLVTFFDDENKVAIKVKLTGKQFDFNEFLFRSQQNLLHWHVS